MLEGWMTVSLVKLTVIFFIRFFWQKSHLSPERCGEEKHIHWRQNRWKLFISNDSYSCCLSIIDVKIFHSIVLLDCTSGKYWLLKVLDFKMSLIDAQDTWIIILLICVCNNGKLHLPLPEMSEPCNLFYCQYGSLKLASKLQETMLKTKT